jgi:glyoxylate reductase
MSLPKVFVTRRIPEAGLAILRSVAEVDLWEGELPPPYPTLIERGRGAVGLLTLLPDRIDGALLDAIGPQLKVVANYAVGFDNIDIPAATARGIAVGNTPGVLTETTADFAWALLMAAARRVVEGDAYTRAGQWKTWGPNVLLGRDVSGATLGIIGFGRIGQAVARRAFGFGMRILYYDTLRYHDAEDKLGVEYASLETVLAEVDYLSLHTALTPETRHLLGPAQFARMKPTAILINTARGPIVDEPALVAALQSGQLGGAALDVFELEPLPHDSLLMKMDNVLLAPHNANSSPAAWERVHWNTLRNLIEGLGMEFNESVIKEGFLEAQPLDTSDSPDL